MIEYKNMSKSDLQAKPCSANEILPTSDRNAITANALNSVQTRQNASFVQVHSAVVIRIGVETPIRGPARYGRVLDGRERFALPVGGRFERVFS